MAMVPHERSLVERLEGKPFVLLGVNGDDDRETLQETVQEKDIPWRSWWDADGKIASQWGVDGLPYIVLIDQSGVIREIIPGRPQDSSYIAHAVDKLLQETQ
jgi:peroxiredoxin